MSNSLKDYYKTEHWKQKREDAFSNWGVCQRCHTEDNLNLHHGSYKNLYEEEFNKDIFLLCKECHTEYHMRTLNINIRSTKDFIMGKPFPERICEDRDALQIKQK